MSDDSFMGFVILALAIVFLFSTGWVAAHVEVKRECDRLGAFYVGDKVYRCEEKKP